MRGVEQSSTALNRRSRGRSAGQRPHGAQRIGRGPGAGAPSFETPPSLPPKGGGRLGRVSGWLAEVLVASKMPSGVSPAGSVGAERCPPGTSAPRRGVLRACGTRPGPTGAEAETPAKNLPPEAFSTLLRLRKATKAAGASVSPAGSVGAERLPPANCAPAPHFSAAASVGRWATSHRDVAAL